MELLWYFIYMDSRTVDESKSTSTCSTRLRTRLRACTTANSTNSHFVSCSLVKPINRGPYSILEEARDTTRPAYLQTLQTNTRDRPHEEGRFYVLSKEASAMVVIWGALVGLW